MTHKIDPALLHLQRPIDKAILRKYPPMSRQARAKIFAPFAALRGHQERLDAEAARLLEQSPA